jgi:SSS family transporter
MQISLSISDYVVMAGYLVGLIVIGYFCSSSKKDSKAYLLGGGKMPYFALGISCLMAALSAFSLVMVPGEIFNHGLSYWVLGLLTPLFTVVTCSIFMRFYFKIGAFTPFEYLERRYSPEIRTLVASLTIYLRLIYLGMVLFSTSKIFEGAAGWPGWVTILLCGGIALIFTTAGGFKAVVWTDVMQFVVLIGGLFCILGGLWIKIDGGLWGGIVYAFQNGRGLDQFAKPEFYMLNPYVRLSFWLLLLGQILAPISIMASDQMTVQRLLASGSYKAAVKTQVVNTCLTIPTIIILWIIGLTVFTFFAQNPDVSAKSGDTALFTFISTQLPSPIPGFIIAGMLAAVISTLNAVFNSMATVYLKEIHLRYLNPGMTEIDQVKVSRIATVAIGLIACGLGLLITCSAERLAQSVVEASTIFNAFEVVIVPAFIFAVLSRRASTLLVWVTAGLLWGLQLGMITWYFLSTATIRDWQPGMAMGWAGPQEWCFSLPLILIGLLVLGLWIYLRKRGKRFTTPVLVLGTSLVGYGLALIIWAIFSNIYCRETARAVSFQWLGLPTFICYTLIGIIWLTFGKVQPKEKYAGLTLFDKSDIIADESKN